VRREAAREADREDLRIERLLHRRQLHPVAPETLELRAKLDPCERDEPLAQPLLRSPQLAVRDLAHALPDALVQGLVEPAGAQVALVEPRELVRQPGLGVDA